MSRIDEWDYAAMRELVRTERCPDCAGKLNNTGQIMDATKLYCPKCHIRIAFSHWSRGITVEKTWIFDKPKDYVGPTIYVVPDPPEGVQTA
jgi:hypothetical protein